MTGISEISDDALYDVLVEERVNTELTSHENVEYLSPPQHLDAAFGRFRFDQRIAPRSATLWRTATEKCAATRASPCKPSDNRRSSAGAAQGSHPPSGRERGRLAS